MAFSYRYGVSILPGMFLLTVPDKGEIPKCQFVAGVLIFSER